jgi:uncharacterized protein (TIGR02246 family)
MRNFLFSTLLLAVMGSGLPLMGSGLQESDAGAVRKTMDRYVAAWLAGDPDAVMRQLTDDSVLIPGANPPHVGAEAVRKYWFPPNAPKFALTRFDNTVDAITGSGDCAVVRGTQVIEWTSGDERWRTRGNYMSVLRRTKDGWRIATQIAANSANERVP